MTDHEDESPEVWIRSGETWFANAQALCKRIGADYLSQTEDGDLYAGISGKGEVPLATLLADELGDSPRLATVTRIK